MVRGFGLGLRPEHYREFASGDPSVDWLEIVSENFMVPGGKPLAFLDRIRSHYAVVMHGVSLSIAGVEPLSVSYLDQLAGLAHRVQPAWISDHLCWTRSGPVNLHDLLPVPFTQEALEHVTGRIDQVQDRLGRALLIENVSAYLRWEGEMTEGEFLAALASRSGCGLLVDVNNIHVNARNLGGDPRQFIDALPARAVRQIHLAGHSDQGGVLIDTHDAAVDAEVWALYEYAIERFGAVPTMIERDDDIPPLEFLLQELDEARRRCARALAAGSEHAVAA